MTTSVPPFRFLDLPREIRDQVYDHTLCYFSRHNEPYTIEQYSRVHVRAPFQPRWFLGTINMLLANRQIHREAHTYMLKTNLFVKVECRGVNIRAYLHGHTPPIQVLAVKTNFGTDSKRLKSVDKFPWYAMRVGIGVDTKATRLRRIRRGEYEDIVLLWEDLRELFKRLEMEWAVRAQRRMSIDLERDFVKMTVEMDPCKRVQMGELDIGDSCRADMSGFFNLGVQKRLLGAILEGIRGLSNLTIVGCADKQFAQRLIKEAERPIWTDAKGFLDALKKQEEDSEKAWLEGDYVQSSSYCAAAISMIGRLRVSPSSLEPFQHLVTGFVIYLAQYDFKFHLSMARCLQLHLSALPHQRTFTNDYVHVSGTCSAIIETLKHIFSDDVPIFPISHADKNFDLEIAEVHYLMARTIRLKGDHYPNHGDSRDKALHHIKAATDLRPQLQEYAVEKRRIDEWVTVLERYVEYRVSRLKNLEEWVPMWEWMRWPENINQCLRHDILYRVMQR